MNAPANHEKHGSMRHHILVSRVAVLASATLFVAVMLLGCGSQQIRLTSPETKAGIGYTCTSATTCYPASVMTHEGAKDEAVALTLPAECNGQFHEILVRNADSSSPEIDVTCAQPMAAPAPSTNATASVPSAQ